ncbi:MAG: hypothetical protein A3G23_14620 [Bacteroidetes bacterium RIFCSPLOWO2_12_FULL_37_12]|nr:MAG: hypothetical protein A3G23_14620 [Bacteroidetes bacterium RIFCSPLOWO2_12_FULL_37_12]
MLFSTQNSFSQNDGTSCGKAIILPPAADLCNKDEFRIKQAEMWFEFTANAPEHELIVSPSVTQPNAEITKLKLFENKCPDLHLRKEVSSQPPELPRMRVEQLIVGQKYIVKAEREALTEAANFEMCLIRDKVGGGDGDETISCTGKNVVNDAWIENTGYPDKLYLCDKYKYLGIGIYTPQEKLEVLGKIKSLGVISQGRIASIGMFPFGGQLSLANPEEQSAGENNSWTLDNGSKTLRAYYNDGTGRKYAFIIDSEGRMGFGKNPVTAYKLDLQGDARINGDLSITGLLHLNNELSGTGNFTTNGNIVSTDGYLKSGNSIIIVGKPIAPLSSNKIFTTNNILALLGGSPTDERIGTMKVGIGTINPIKALHIKTIHITNPESGTPHTHYGIRLEDNDINPDGAKNSIWDIEPIAADPADNRPLFFSAVNDNGSKIKVLTMFKNGNVGIGTDSPYEKLDVNGNVKISDDLTIVGKIKVNKSALFEGETTIKGGLCINSIICDSPEPFHIKNKNNLDLYMFVGVNKDYTGDQVGDGKVEIGAFETGVGFKDFILQPHPTGRVGIGKTNPQHTLDVNGEIVASRIGVGTSPSSSLHVKSLAGAYGYSIISEVNDARTKAFVIWYNGVETFKIYGDGLAAATGMWLTVAEQFPDYVFERNYSLLPFETTINDLKEKKHLRGIPSAAEVKQKGYEVGDFNLNHLKATEELYLYVNQINNKFEKLKEDIENLKKENEELKKEIKNANHSTGSK